MIFPVPDHLCMTTFSSKINKTVCDDLIMSIKSHDMFVLPLTAVLQIIC